MITREADLVTAHEFGHNWGSEHDPDISVSYSIIAIYLLYRYIIIASYSRKYSMKIPLNNLINIIIIINIV